MKRRVLLLVLVLLGWALAPSACLAPTLPLPPPEEPASIEPASVDGEWTIRGTCTRGSIVLITNERTGAIVGYEDRGRDGRYAVDIAAERCDPGTVMEIVGEDVSSSATFLIREVVNGVAQTDCPGDPL